VHTVPSVPSQSLLDRTFWWWVAAMMLPFMSVVAARWDQPPAVTDGDYAQYLLHARAIAEGKNYSDIGYIYTDRNFVGPENQPPGWPLVLAPVVGAFGIHSPAVKVVTVAMLVAFTLIAAAYVRRANGSVVALVVAAVVPLSLEAQRATATALSDPLFAALTWSSLYLADDMSRRATRRFAGAGAIAIAALLTRVAGIALLPTLVLTAVIRRDLPRVPIAMAIIAILATVAGLTIFADHIPFMSRVLQRWPGIELTSVLRTYRLSFAEATLYPFSGGRADDVYHALIAIPLLVGGALFAIRSAGSAAWCFCLCYGLLLVAAPVRESRYAWPLIPLFVAWVVTGSLWLIEKLAAGQRRVAHRAAATVAALVVLAGTAGLVRTPAPRSFTGDPDTAAVFEQVRSLHEREASGIRVAFFNPRVLTLQTGVSAMGVPWGPDPGDVLQELEAHGISHLVVTGRRREDAGLRALAADQPARFESVYRNESYEILRLVSAGSTSGNDSRDHG
jgi:hypothetical protein